MSGRETKAAAAARGFTDTATRALEEELRRHVRGEVRFRPVDRALYSTDSSNYRQIPIGAVLPLDIDDALEALAVCRRHDAPLVNRGGGTSLAGQTTNRAVVFDFSKYVNCVLELDPERRQARVEPGCIFDEAREQAEGHGLTLAFDTSTHDRATIGGMIGNNACGIHSVLAQTLGAGSGRAEDNVHELDIVTYDGLRMTVGATSDDELEAIIRAGGRRGEMYAGLARLRDRYADFIRRRFPDIPRRVSGYNLPQLLPEHGFHLARALVGSEGTCVTILGATVALVPSPPKRALLVLGYEDVFSAGDHVPEVMAAGPVGLEAIDEHLVSNMRRKRLNAGDLDLLPQGRGWLLAEFGGATQKEAESNARECLEAVRRSGKTAVVDAIVYADPQQQERIWEIRESGLGATAFVPDQSDAWPGWEDSAVPPEVVGDYLRDLRGLLHRYGYEAALYGHFGQGCVHCRIPFGLTSEQSINDWKRFLHEAADLVVGYGGSLSGEHGDGQARAELLPKMFGEEIVQAFREFKAIWDPDNRMNPGKVVDAYPMDAHLRLGAGFEPPQLETYFQYPDDGGSFSRAVMRCVGVGKCRRTGGGVMCPSFMATREEMHTTRGRARTLFEMVHAKEPVEQVWRSTAVREALDLCLACKGCKADCPVDVDMATYKAEFMAHHYKRRLRPRSFYSMGMIYWWSRMASTMPRIANAVLEAPGLGSAVKAAAGISHARRFPSYAHTTLRKRFQRREARNEDAPPVIFFPDTFTNYFQPETGMAAIEALEDAGYQVRMPDRPLCCGRPLYDKGFLGLARSLLQQLIDELGPAAAGGVSVVGTEPSCIASFRDELVNLFPEDGRARKLSEQTFLLSEFLHNNGYAPPKLERKALVQFHCNHHAVLGKQPEIDLLRAMGIEAEILDSGCCGMAGSFGFEKEHYDVSIACGERVLLPAVRAADAQTLILADGFSCREQIAQCTDREAIHIADAIRMGIRDDARS